MGKFNSGVHNIYYYGQESHGRNGITLIIHKRAWNAVLECNFKKDRVILVHFQANHKHHSNLSLFLNHWCWRSRSWPFLWRPRRPSRANTQKRCPLHHRGLECKSRKSRDTGSNRQVCSWNTKWSKAKANRVLPRESKHSFLTTQEMTLHMGIAKCSIPKSDWLYSLQWKMDKLHTDSKYKAWRWLWLRSSAPYSKIQA